MLSLGIELSRAFWMAVASVAFDSGSGPPSFAATMIARESFEKSWPRLASAAPFLRLMVAHLLCPDNASPFSVALAPPAPGARHLHEPRVQAAVVGELRVEGGHQHVPLARGDRAPRMAGQHLDP